MKNKPRFISAEDAAALAQRLAEDVHSTLQGALRQRELATLVVSGGTTPLPFFTALRNKPLDWQRVRVTLADERWVAPTHADSNERFVREHLLQEQAGDADFVGLYNGSDDMQSAQLACQQALQRLLPFDCVVLGMGSDGHTASLFPATTGLQAALDPASDALCAVMQPASTDRTRMTLTLKALLDTASLALHITGENKRQVYLKALQDSAVEDAPVAALLRQQQTPLTVYWSP